MKWTQVVVMSSVLFCGCELFGGAPISPAAPDGGAHDSGVFDAGVMDAGGDDAGFDAGVMDAGVDDAGFDAGVVDAGADDAGFDAGMFDAGVIDAGVDAGMFDAGVIDAGIIDAGFDAGVFDAGIVDAGFDAGVFDAGVVDSGVPDAGPVLAVGAPCVNDIDCKSGLGTSGVCRHTTASANATYPGGYCTRPCGAGGGGACPSGADCVSTAMNHYGEFTDFCLDLCGADAGTCRSGYACYGVDAGESACWLSPAPAYEVPDKIGIACADDVACSYPPETGGVCLTTEYGYAWGSTGGYCSRNDCLRELDCSLDGGASCVDFGSGNLCVGHCPAVGTQSTCRAGYSCAGYTVTLADGGAAASSDGLCLPLSCTGGAVPCNGQCVMLGTVDNCQSCGDSCGLGQSCSATGCAYNFEVPRWEAPAVSPANATYENDGGTVLDTATGLLWQRASPAGTFNRGDAGVYCDGLVLSGVSDWRLPTYVELLTLVDYGLASGARLNASAFPSEPATRFWASTPYATGSGSWSVDFSDGTSDVMADATLLAARCVKWVPSAQPPSRFTVSASTVVDAVTGLEWQRVAGTASSVSAAAASCVSGFRLPTEKELTTIVDIRFNNPAYDTTVFLPLGSTDYYWSSTVNAANASQQWVVLFNGGATRPMPSSSYYVRCVR